MGVEKKKDACRLGDLLPEFVRALGPVHDRFDSVADAWDGLLPDNLRSHCRLGSFSDGCLKSPCRRLQLYLRAAVVQGGSAAGIAAIVPGGEAAAD